MQAMTTMTMNPARALRLRTREVACAGGSVPGTDSGLIAFHVNAWSRNGAGEQRKGRRVSAPGAYV